MPGGRRFKSRPRYLESLANAGLSSREDLLDAAVVLHRLQRRLSVAGQMQLRSAAFSTSATEPPRKTRRE
jgi:hypothetical protein